MKLSTLFSHTMREAPSEAEHAGHQLVMRAGIARQLQAGSYALMPLGMRALRRVEAIIHEELGRIDAQELRMPLIQSAETWHRSGRFAIYGPQMLRLTDRADRALVFAPTHEEVVVELARREIESYRHMPVLVYQIHTKYRDELRPKGALMRLREFSMMDAYSLDAHDAGLDAAYSRLAVCFERIFKRCGVRFVVVEASNGEMGGSESREYMALTPSGEDTLVICQSCGYAANLEVAVANHGLPGRPAETQAAGGTQAIATPECKTIAELASFLGIPQAATAKAVFFDTPERGLVFAVIRGDLEVNEDKLRTAAGVSDLAPAGTEQIATAGAVAGYASPVGLTAAAANAGTAGGVTVIADPSVVAAGPLVAGANRAGYHLLNVVYGRDWQASIVADIAAVRAGDRCARCDGQLTLQRGAEIGHIFKLGSRFATALGATFLDETGVARPIVMGSYGIGMDRLLQIIVDQNHDDAGIIWPAEVAPFDMHLLRLGRGEASRSAAEDLLAELKRAGYSVLYDDRDETAGVKFNDADLIGLPLRLLVSDRLLTEGMVELKPRGGVAEKVARAELLDRLSQR